MTTTTDHDHTQHPAFAEFKQSRTESLHDRIADGITTFAGSMRFVYLHIVWFGAWIVLNTGMLGKGAVFDEFPFGLLTMIVSLEAIFLSTFVMISQNRQDARREVLASHEWMLVQEEEKQNEDLLKISNEILALTREVHALQKGTG